jgi:pyridoxine 5'-phosphate synthase PdxJ
VVFSSTPYAQAPAPQDAEDELARLSTAILATHKFGLRVAVMGALYPHLIRPLLEIEGIEEIYPGPEIWLRALRVGWDRALTEYRTAMGRP